ncbi:amidase domain-containing protein [Salipaludibacillus aurantiacus]|uniref:Putative amidase domain-containing protein n=1 Tax=Salipaludibacillus aurantiacus TaxID=1601833 RepID=A0A1H9X9L3_9BACI|nr:amidase domain-containing protein [Salipaludibacillus aurantiacus]SES42567.1 Putative amidase domain-containing protein [Salipaludibacillus aurantiacus]
MKDIMEVMKNYWENSCYPYISGGEKAEITLPFVREDEAEAAERKLANLKRREAKIVKNMVDGYIINHHQSSYRTLLDYLVTLEHFIYHKNKPYLETQIQARRAVIDNGELIDDYVLEPDGFFGTCEKEYFENEGLNQTQSRDHSDAEIRFSYNRLAAVRYAERWWNDYNPAYRRFENDCTNYISQCLKAGGAPMRGLPVRNQGWWYQEPQWSFSWSVAHSLRWYLSGSNKGLRAVEVNSPEELMKGDVICYDFTGDDRWQHTTIVVDKDADYMPLVNAHTTNSRMRYWAYEDSTAWTPEIRYKFFHITG